MGKSTNIPGLKLIHDQQKPIFIHGMLGHLQGTLNLLNDSESKVTLKTMPVQAPKLRSMTLEPINEARLFGRLYPNQQGSVPFELLIDPYTPPGTYEATVQVGEKSQTAQIIISENIELDVEPDAITLNVVKDRTFTREFIFTNVGNVATSVGGDWRTALRSQQGMDAELVQLLQEITEKKKKVSSKKGNKDNATDDEYSLTSLLYELSSKCPGPATVSFENIILEPGETRVVKATIDLPDNMQTNMHYTTELDLYSANIQLNVYNRS